MEQIKFSSDFSKNLWVDFCLNLSVVTFMMEVETRKEMDPSFNDEKFKRDIIDNWLGKTNTVLKGQINDYFNTIKDSPKNAFSSLINQADPEDLNENSTKAMKEIKAIIEKVIMKSDES